MARVCMASAAVTLWQRPDKCIRPVPASKQQGEDCLCVASAPAAALCAGNLDVRYCCLLPPVRPEIPGLLRCWPTE